MLKEAKQYIPTRTVKEFKGTNPWLNDVCREAIVHKHSKEGTDGYKDASEQCTRTLRNAYGGYIHKTREELKSLPRGSKRWWSLNKILMDNAPSKSGIPSLREPGSQWVHDAREKADMFAHTFSAKFGLPVAVEEEPVEDEEPSSHMSNFVVIRERWVLQEFGHEAETAQHNGLESLSNGTLSAEAFRLGFRCILTQDKTFALDAAKVLESLPELAVVLVLTERIPQKPRETYLERFRDALRKHPLLPVPGCVVHWP